MKVLICGDRNWSDYQIIKDLVAELRIRYGSDLQVCEGAARGADYLAGKACAELGVEVTEYPAEWSKYGRAAGPKRNRQMLDEFKPDAVYAFHDDLEHSKGTKNMVKQAESRGLSVTVKAHALRAKNLQS